MQETMFDKTPSPSLFGIRKIVSASFFVIALMLTTVTSAQIPNLDLHPLGKSLSVSPQNVLVSSQIIPGKGEKAAELQITAKIKSGWHINSLNQGPGGPKPTVITLKRDDSQYKLLDGFRADRLPHIRHEPDIWGDLDLEEYEGMVIWSAPVEPQGTTSLNGLAISGEIQGQACENPGARGLCQEFNEGFTARVPGSVSPPSTIAAPKTIKTFSAGGVIVSGSIDKKVVAPGNEVTLTITLDPQKDYHVSAFSDQPSSGGPTLVVLDKRSGLDVSGPQSDKLVIDKVIPELGDLVQRYYSGPVKFSIPIKIPESAAAGNYPVAGAIGYLACGEKNCELPTGAAFSVSIPVAAASQPGNLPIAFAPTSYSDVSKRLRASPWDANLPLIAGTPGTPTTLEASNSWSTIGEYMVWAFLAGLILNVMPCVLPVIGLKIMSFVSQAGESRSRVFALNLAYVIGLISVFMVLALAAILLGLTWGDQFNNYIFTISLAAVVFVFALSFLGVWEIPIPGFVGSGSAVEMAEKEG
ncbi:MAG: hypothetical protein N2C12_01625, partial [Planctomycetales bacterium]